MADKRCRKYPDVVTFAFWISDDVMELRDLCNDKRCQTNGVAGAREWLLPLVKSGLKGVDRIADIGHTMDFELVWDGYELMQMLARSIAVRC